MRTRRTRCQVDPAGLLRTARQLAGHGQVEAAELLGSVQSHLSRIERGERLPGRRLALRIEQQYGVPMSAWDA
jgi:transcriptional regulator with XRE-family HTH domain